MTDTATATRQRGHVITITRGEDCPPEEPYSEHSVTCLVPDLCGGFVECPKPHEVNGKSAEDGPWDADEGDPWDEEEEVEFHGVLHTWRTGHGWTVPYEGCVVAAADLFDAVHEIAGEHGPGSYLIDDEWDDDICRLRFVGRVEAVR